MMCLQSWKETNYIHCRYKAKAKHLKYISSYLPNSKNRYGLSAKAMAVLLKQAVNSQRRSSKKQKALATGRLQWHTVM